MKTGEQQKQITGEAQRSADPPEENKAGEAQRSADPSKRILIHQKVVNQSTKNNCGAQLTEKSNGVKLPITCGAKFTEKSSGIKLPITCEAQITEKSSGIN